MSALEAFFNATIGLFISWAFTFFCLPFWGLEPTGSASAVISGSYFLISFARSWAIREVFRRMS